MIYYLRLVNTSYCVREIIVNFYNSVNITHFEKRNLNISSTFRTGNRLKSDFVGKVELFKKKA